MPAALASGPRSVGLRGETVTVVTRSDGGTLLAESGSGWRALTSRARLGLSAATTLDSVTWADRQLGWLTGLGADALVQTVDGGATWHPVKLAGPAVTTVLSPCGSGPIWSVPLVGADGKVRILATNDAGSNWHLGAAVAVTDNTIAWGCASREVWLISRDSQLLVSSDGGSTWQEVGRSPADVTGLAPTGATTGFAVTGQGGSARLYSVRLPGPNFVPVPLPDWINQLSDRADSG
ncbi:MAG: Photosynthesis system assembly factor [Pseudonocardiales bacterium]|nr:Photosynthesis system assembly factor [Pseudonocardiales bacterium]